MTNEDYVKYPWIALEKATPGDLFYCFGLSSGSRIDFSKLQHWGCYLKHISNSEEGTISFFDFESGTIERVNDIYLGNRFMKVEEL